MNTRALFVPIGLFFVLFFGDISQALAQSSSWSKTQNLYAEASKSTRRRRTRREPTPEPADQPADTDTNDTDDADDAPGSPTPEQDDPAIDENPFQSKNDAAANQEPSGDSGSPLRRSNRMDFDERLVKGQGARSGAVYLFKRTPRALPELVSLRTSYRSRITDPILGARRTGPSKVAPTPVPEPITKNDSPQQQPLVQPEKAAETKTKRRRRRTSLGGARSTKSSPSPQKGQ